MSMPDETYIDQYINDGENDARSLQNTYDTVLIGDVNDTSNIYRVPTSDFFLKHHAELENSISLYQLDENLFYKPKALSLQEYGTTELWISLLRVNNMRSIAEFHQPMIFIYNPDSVLELMKTFFKREDKM